MKRLNIREQILNFLFMLLMQLPLIHRISLFDHAFGFFYVGFLLFLPVGLSRTNLMLIGFATGLVVDVFSSTPGMHSLSCVVIMFLRNFWISVLEDDWKEIGNVNFLTLQWLRFFSFVLPLVLVHHFILFMIENGGFHLFGMVLQKVILSTLFSTSIIFGLSFLMSSRQRNS